MFQGALENFLRPAVTVWSSNRSISS